MTTAVASTQLPIEEVAQLRGSVEQFVRSALARDWDALTALLTDDVVFLPPDQRALEGKAAVRTWLEVYPLIRAFTAGIVSAEGTSNLASVRGSFAMILEVDTNRSLSMTGKWCATYRKQPYTDWLCAYHIWNLDAPPTAG
jgi:ketosteroid isomerase-like protein